MPYYAWYSKTSANKEGTATWSRLDGSEVEISFVADGPDELSVQHGLVPEPPDLVFLGRVLKCTRLATELPLRPEDFIDPGDFE